MLKVSAERSAARRAALVKSAGPVGDYAAANVPGIIPVANAVYGPANVVGRIAGLLTDTPDSLPASSAKSWIPGVAGYRQSQRIRKVVSESNKAGRRGTLNAVSELVGGGTSLLASALAGAGIGSGVGALASKISGKDVGGGAGAGAGIGAIAGLGVGSAATIAGALLAAVKARRTKQEQIDNDTGDTALRNFLIPGAAAYNGYKRYGASGNYDK